LKTYPPAEKDFENVLFSRKRDADLIDFAGNTPKNKTAFCVIKA
jgi:hypothetical protein